MCSKIESNTERSIREVGNIFRLFYYLSAIFFLVGIVIMMVTSATLPEYGLTLTLVGIVLLLISMNGAFGCALDKEFCIIKKALKIKRPEK